MFSELTFAILCDCNNDAGCKKIHMLFHDRIALSIHLMRAVNRQPRLPRGWLIKPFLCERPLIICLSVWCETHIILYALLLFTCSLCFSLAYKLRIWYSFSKSPVRPSFRHRAFSLNRIIIFQNRPPHMESFAMNRFVSHSKIYSFEWLQNLTTSSKRTCLSGMSSNPPRYFRTPSI